MKFNEITYILSFGILIITALYTLIYAGLTGLLLCSSVSLITAAFLDQFEIVVAITVLFSLFYIYFLKRLFKKFEPFGNPDIVNKVGNMKDTYKPTEQSLKGSGPYGVYNPSIEGFESVSDEDDEGASSESSKASTKRDNEINTEAFQEIAKAVTAPKQGDKKQGFKNKGKKQDDEEEEEDDEEKHKAIQKEEFQSATNELFKLGKMPSEHAEGPLLDAGSTLLKAMSSFKPEQITAMSSDTKQLLETQKNLMGMLNQMRPVLADGRELLNTFSGMFGNK